MSYLVLARRWRPQKFSDLVGQDVVVRTLKNALSGGNLAHAYLLCGIRGVGKTTIARLMAMAVNCEQPDAGEPCGSCAACTGIADGSNLDVQEMDGASHTGVDDVREILDGVRYPPSRLKCKVYIIDEAHMLSKSAFNALLKTLEEPPANVLFILATTEAEKLPVTVRSRCQRFDLRRLGQSEIAAYLQHVFTAEKIRADADAIAAIASAADGSVRDALSLAERVLAYNSDQLQLSDVQSALGLVGSELVCRLSQAILAADARHAIEVLRTAVARAHAPRTLLLELSQLWHQISCLKVDASLLADEVDSDYQHWLEQHAALLDLQALDLRYQVLLNGIRDLAVVDERMGSEMVVIRLCGLNSISPVGDVTVQPLPQELKSEKKHSSLMFEAAPEGDVHREPATATEKPVEQKVEQPEPDLPLQNQSPGTGFRDWKEIVEAFGKIKPGVSAMLEHVICVEFAENKVRLALDKHQERALATPDRLAFAEWLGREVFWESQKDHKGESLSQERERQARAETARLRKQAEEDPHIQSLMQEMDAQLVKVLPSGVEPDELI